MVRRKHVLAQQLRLTQMFFWIKARYAFMYDLYFYRVYQYMLYLKPINLNGLYHIIVFILPFNDPSFYDFFVKASIQM